MKYLLDTNACIRYLNDSSASVRGRLEKIAPGDVGLCSVVKCELYYGAAKGQIRDKTIAALDLFFETLPSLPFDDQAAAVYGAIRAELERRGTPIGANDLMIAAIALANGLTLVTHNSREFGRIKGLALDDWE